MLGRGGGAFVQDEAETGDYTAPGPEGGVRRGTGGRRCEGEGDRGEN